jgi:hypothetical protein
MNNDQKGWGRRRTWPNLRHYSEFRLEGLRYTTKDRSQYSRTPCRGLNSGPLKYEAGLLHTRSLRSVPINRIFVCKSNLQVRKFVNPCMHTISAVGKRRQANATLYRVFFRRSVFFIRHSIVAALCLFIVRHTLASFITVILELFFSYHGLSFLLSLRAHDICLQFKMATAWNQTYVTKINMETSYKEMKEAFGLSC